MATDWPFDSERDAYAVITARTEYGYGHLNLEIINPLGFGRSYPDDALVFAFTNQCGDTSRDHDRGEPFYAWRIGARSNGADRDGLSLSQCERAVKMLRTMHARMTKIEGIAGGPARRVEEQIMRCLNAARVQHVYAEERIGHGGRIPDWPYFTPDRFAVLRSHLEALRWQLVKQCCREPANAE